MASVRFEKALKIFFEARPLLKRAGVFAGAMAAIFLLAFYAAAPADSMALAAKVARLGAELALTTKMDEAKLGKIMSPEAFAAAKLAREASGLDKALAQAGSSLSGKAEVTSVSRSGVLFEVRGDLSAKLRRSGEAQAYEEWSGAFRAELEQLDAGSMRIVKLDLLGAGAGH